MDFTWNVTMGEEPMCLRDTPSPTPSLATPHFGFGFRVANKESLPSSLPSRFEKILDVLRTSCPC